MRIRRGKRNRVVVHIVIDTLGWETIEAQRWLKIEEGWDKCENTKMN